MSKPIEKLRRSAEEFLPSDNHWRIRNFRERITREQLKYHLLNNADPIFEGQLWQWKSKHLGVGVYELYMMPRKKAEKEST